MGHIDLNFSKIRRCGSVYISVILAADVHPVMRKICSTFEEIAHDDIFDISQ